MTCFLLEIFPAIAIEFLSSALQVIKIPPTDILGLAAHSRRSFIGPVLALSDVKKLFDLRPLIAGSSWGPESYMLSKLAGTSIKKF